MTPRSSGQTDVARFGRRTVALGLLGGLLAACGTASSPPPGPQHVPPDMALPRPSALPATRPQARPADLDQHGGNPGPRWTAPAPGTPKPDETGIAINGRPPIRVELLGEMTGPSDLLALPMALALDRQGQVYVADGGHDHIAVFDRDGRFVRAWGGPGAAAGQFRFRVAGGPGPDGDQPGNCLPTAGGVVVDGDERVYVADYGNHRIQVFDRDGRFLTMWSGDGDSLRRPLGLAVDADGLLHLGDAETGRIHRLDRTGRSLALWRNPQGSAVVFRQPGPLAIDDRGALYVADADGVWKLDRTGRVVAHWVPGDSLGAPRPASGLAVDRQGYVYVAHCASAGLHIQQFDSSGHLLVRWSHDWFWSGYLLQPSGLAVAANEPGDVYVADPASRRVLKYRVLMPVDR